MRKLHTRKVARYMARLENRLAAGEDRYFEELREIEAYDPRKRPPWQNVALEVIRMLAFFISLTVLLLNWGK